MISFSELNGNNADELARRLSEGREELREEIFEVISSFSEVLDEGADFAFCRFEDHLLVRIYDGENYVFVYPIALTDDAKDTDALEQIRLYAVREEVPLIFCDVPPEALSVLENFFRYTEAYGEDEDSLQVRVLSDISRAADIPEVCDGVLTLRPICEGDIADYARLCRDAELNKYWGYDYRADAREPSDEYFYDVAMRSAEDGTALSLAVSLDGRFVGEATLWGFDLLGGCKVGFRILPEWQGRGFGKRTLTLLLELCSELCVKTVCASVMKDNAPSIAVVGGIMSFCRQEDGINYYIYKLA